MSVYLKGLEQFGLTQADRYFDEMQETFLRLATFPEMGRRLPELRQAPRMHAFRAHLIFYTIDDAGIMIHRIRHHNEDWQND